MERKDILEKIKEVLQDTLDVEDLKISEETTASDIEGWDSLAHIAIISEVEDVFGVRFPMKSVLNMKNLGEMIDLIEELTR